MSQEIFNWLIFNVLISLIPFSIDVFRKLIVQEKDVFGFLRDGQLLLVAVALGADAFGGLLFKQGERNMNENTFVAGCILTTLISAFLYPILSGAKPMKDRKVFGIFTLYWVLGISSLVFFCGSLYLSYKCKEIG